MAAASPPNAPTAAAPAQDSPPPSGLKSVGRHAIWYAIGQVLGKAVAFLMLPIYTRYLTPADYGVAALIEMTLDVVAIVAGAQVAAGIFRFYHKADTEGEKKAVVATTLTTLLISYTAFSVAVFFTAAPLSTLVFDSPEHADLIQLAAGSFLLQSLIVVAMAFGRVQDRSRLVVGMNMTKLLLSVGFNLLFVVALRMGVKGVFISTLASNAIVALIYGTWTVRHVGFGIRPDILRSLIRYGVPLIGVQAATFTMTFSDRYFLQAAGDETMVGLYNLAYQFGFLLLMLGFVPIEMVWGPRRFQVARGPNPSQALAKVFRLVCVSVFTIGVGIALFVGDLLRVMSTPPFHPAAEVVPVILVAYVFHGWAMLHDIGVLITERTEYLTIANWVAAAVAVAAFAVLIPQYHAMGAAIGAILAFGTRWGLTYFYSQRLWHVDYEWMPIIRLAVVAVAVSVTSALLPDTGIIASIAIHLALFAVYCGLLWVMPILTAEEKQTGLMLARRGRQLIGSRVGLRS